MRKIYLIFVFLLIATPQSTAWGFAVHNKVASNATDIMDGDFQNFLLDNIGSVKSKSVEPDQIKSSDPTEGPRHYDDSDIEHMDINVSSTSEDYDLGVISWAILNVTNNLADAILDNNADGILHYAGYIAHYAADATQPLHATKNYDGQFTGNSGIHSRFESELVSRNFYDSFSNTTFNELKIVDPYNATKNIIASGLNLTSEIYYADDVAKNDTDYYDVLWNMTSYIVIDRLNLATQFTANLWFTAYQMAVKNGLEVFSPVFQVKTTSSQVNSNPSSVETPVGLLFIFSIPLIALFRKKKTSR